jgi:hypothetical protein
MMEKDVICPTLSVYLGGWGRPTRQPAVVTQRAEVWTVFPPGARGRGQIAFGTGVGGFSWNGPGQEFAQMVELGISPKAAIDRPPRPRPRCWA